MKNLLNILLIISLSVWILGGVIMPIIHFVHIFFYDMAEYKEMVLTTMVCSFGVTIPIGLYNTVNGGSPTLKLPNTTKSQPKQKYSGCKSCKKK